VSRPRGQAPHAHTPLTLAPPRSREFEDEKVLLQHQKAKHYRCPQCPRRLNTAGGLTVHLAQVHKAEPGKCVAARGCCTSAH
jgi:hypothetical protein